MLKRTHVIELVAVLLGVAALWATFVAWRDHQVVSRDFSIPAAPEPLALAPKQPQPLAHPAPAQALTAPTRDKPQLDARGLPHGWAVSVGLFSAEPQAQAELARLLALGHDAFLRERAEGIEVLVGPKLDPRTAATLAEQLLGQGVAKPEVVEYQPSLGRGMVLAPSP